MSDFEHFEPGEELNLTVKVHVSFSIPADVDKNELSAAISAFAYKFIKEVYLCK